MGEIVAADAIRIIFAAEDRPTSGIGIILSIIGISFILFSWWYLKLTQHALSRMVIWITIADAIFVLPVFTVLLILGIDKVNCTISVLIAHYGVICSFCWAACFTHAVKASVQAQNESIINSNFKYYFWICAVVPIPAVIGAGLTNFVSYDPHGRVCYHDMPLGSIDWSWMLFDDLFFAAATLVSSYFSIVAVVKMTRNFGGNRWQFLKILLYPLVLIVIWFPKILNDLLVQVRGSEGFSETAANIIIIINQAQGFTNAIIYGFSHVVINGYKEKCCKNRHSKEISWRSLCFGCCVKSVSQDKEDIVHSSVSNKSETELKRALIDRTRSAKLSDAQKILTNRTLSYLPSIPS